QTLNNNVRKLVTQIPNLLQSISTLTRYKISDHFNQEDQQSLKIRYNSRQCLRQIQEYGDPQVQSELLKVGYVILLAISFSTAGGIGEEQNKEIWNGLNCIYWFLLDLHKGRNIDQIPSFQPLPQLVRRSEEQIEEEGANEEIETQMKNIGSNGNIKDWANLAKAASLNRFIHKSNLLLRSF
ncbi:MAG: hypothetical protein EZS28_045120, partial [Streblomastix strix]